MTTWQASNLMRVAESYKFEDGGTGRILEQPGRVERSRFYNPWESPELLSEFAAIQPGDEEKVLDFSHQWGSIYEVLDKQAPKFPGGDPLDFIEQHAAIVRFALNLIKLIQLRDSNGVDDYLSLVWPEVERHVLRQLLSDQRAALQKALKRNGLRAGSEVLSALINARITEQVGPVYQPTDDGPLRRVTKATQLLEVIYCHLADAGEGNQGYYQCERRGCPKWWPVDREARGPKPKYCPPEGGKGESLCSRRERYYRSPAREARTLKEEANGQAQR